MELVRRSHFVSLGLHIVAFWGLMNAPTFEVPRRAPSEYEQMMAAQRPKDKIVLYKFRKELPAVTPNNRQPTKESLRAEKKADQAIVSSALGLKRDQMVWTPAPEVSPAVPLDSANLLALRLPPPAPKAFVPPDIVRTPAPPVDVPVAPELTALAELKVPELQARRLARQFIAPERQTPKSPSPVKTLEDAPQLAANNALVPSNLPTIKVPPRSYRASAAPARTPKREVAKLEEAPDVAATSAPGSSQPVLSTKLPPKRFTAPAASSGRGRATSAAPSLEAPPQNDPLNTAVVGLRPVENAITLPTASSPASFSASPKVNPAGAATEPGAQGLSVPGLFVKGPARTAPTGPDSAKAAELIAQARTAPTSQQALASVMRSGEPVMSSRTFTAPTPTANATRVTSAPDPRLSGREVYMMAIQMPNLTSFSGSWLMWYAATTATEVSAAPLAPPVAHRKVDPKYVATAAEERVQGNVRLACRIDGEGHVSRVELLHGLDARLDQTAADALSRWEFYPATRGGEPVAVDVVVEIPFRLAPTKTGKK
jgi:TonB family protein